MATNKTWSGTDIDDLYENNGPYSFVYPPVTPSKHHAVLYELPVTLTSPPKPHQSLQTHHWEENYVKLPYSPQNVFPIENNVRIASLSMEQFSTRISRKLVKKF